MMRNTTFNLPNDLVQHAKAYAAQHGTTVTALVRDHLERVTGYCAARPQQDDPLMAFSEGRMTKEAAVAALGLRDYSDLLLALGERRLLTPSLPRHEVEAMADTMVRLLGRRAAGGAASKPRCVLVIPDAGPINSLWTAGRLDLLLALGIPIVMVDAVYDELTGDPANYAKDREVKAFLDALAGTRLTVEETFVGQQARIARQQGTFRANKGIGDAAVAEFMGDGIGDYVDNGSPVLLLFEDADFRSVRFVRKSDNLHMLSTVAMLRGMERMGLIESADTVIAAMTNPTDPTKRPRMLRDLPDGFEDEAVGGSTWQPGRS
ncbi:hypothetical protein [Limobrevibacterium gyesilva]|uniref:Uncharacterized protein n=1 Tax=Limobrevibacterium gyesilva TaxID=2991712 RepID=A0AA41YW24_9PROT|nr:hypothetical protein [Limobrevibacterium gyesilva]MCW3477533.1 hypothetical protein [Limobrevibacterium gyesilva]